MRDLRPFRMSGPVPVYVTNVRARAPSVPFLYVDRASLPKTPTSEVVFLLERRSRRRRKCSVGGWRLVLVGDDKRQRKKVRPHTDTGPLAFAHTKTQTVLGCSSERCWWSLASVRTDDDRVTIIICSNAFIWNSKQ